MELYINKSQLSMETMLMNEFQKDYEKCKEDFIYCHQHAKNTLCSGQRYMHTTVTTVKIKHEECLNYVNEQMQLIILGVTGKNFRIQQLEI